MDIDSLKAASLNENDIPRLMALAEKHVENWDNEQPIKYTSGVKRPRQLKDYFLQYLPVYGKSGNKLVWINFIWKSDVKELLQTLFTSADNPHYSNCWVSLPQEKILSR